jgi:hypothetical protein
MPGGTYTAIFATGNKDDFESYHAARGYGEITLG